MAGHLATITDAGENDFIAGLANNRIGYLGATDAEVEGEWQSIPVNYGPIPIGRQVNRTIVAALPGMILQARTI